MSLHTKPQKRNASAIFSLTALLDLREQASEFDSAEMILKQAAQILQARVRSTFVVAVMYSENVVQQVPIGNKLFKGVPRIHVTEVTTLECASTEHTLFEQGIRTIVPLMYNNTCAGYIGLGDSAADVELPDDIESYLLLAGTIVGTAIKNAELVQSQRSVQKDLEHHSLMVSTLLEAASDFTGAMSVTQILKTLQFHLSGRFMVSRFGIVLTEPLDGVRILGSTNLPHNIHELAPQLLNISQPLVTNQLPNDNPMKEFLASASISMVTPTEVHGVKKGVLALGNRLHSMPFTSQDVSFLEALANTAMAAMENDRLFLQERKQEQLLQELEIAANIQRGMLPVELPVIQHLDVAATMVPSQQVGGDYYDVIVLDEHRTLLAIADVTGKGIPAALLMANVQAAINVLAHMNIPLNQLVQRINALLCDNTEPDVFVTMFVAIVNTQTSTIEYVNAGHNPPILYSPLPLPQLQTLTVGGPLTGVIPGEVKYAVAELSVQKGAILCLYTDGVSEARNTDGHEFEDHRLAESLKYICSEGSTQLASTILHSLLCVVDEFRGSYPAHDDSSLVLIRFI